MNQQTKNRRVLVGGVVLALVAYAVYSHFGSHFDRHHDSDAVAIAVDTDSNSKADSGNSSTPVEISADNKTGTLGIKTPGFSGNVTIPGLDLGKGDMNFDGIKLYPGAKLGQMKVNGSGDDNGQVSVDFDAPASATAVHDYYAKALAEKGFTVDPSKSSVAKIVAAKEDDSKRFDLTLSSNTATSTHGVMTISSE